MKYDFLVVGGGILGASTAWQLQQNRPGASIALLEKESQLAAHQTGRNSGVIHAGVYYAPGSLKARFCREGVAATIDFCRTYDIPFEQCGKLLVATCERELEWMNDLYARARENQIDCELLDRAELRAREPRITGSGAVFVRSTGVVDFAQIARKMVNVFQASGGEVQLACEVYGIREGSAAVTVASTRGDLEASYVVCCAGLMADRLAAMAGLQLDCRIIPFRGEYYQLPPGRSGLIRHLIYPIPDPSLPFLGVHLTRMIDGRVTVGPNAVLALKREAYSKIDASLRDIAEMLAFPGFWKLTLGNLKFGLSEFRNSLSKRSYLQQIRKYCPELTVDDLLPHPAGVRAQAVSRTGELIHDFLITHSARTIHVCNAPSPAATSAIPIGRHIVNEIHKRFDIGTAHR